MRGSSLSVNPAQAGSVAVLLVGLGGQPGLQPKVESTSPHLAEVLHFTCWKTSASFSFPAHKTGLEKGTQYYCAKDRMNNGAKSHA